MLIGLFVFASSSTISGDAMVFKDHINMNEDCVSFDIEDDLEQALLADMDPFCPYYKALEE